MDTPKSGEFAHIGKSVVIKGELAGSEDLYIDGYVSGTIELRGNSLTVGPNGRVEANVNAKGVIIQGKLEGNVQASDRVELKKSAVMMGDIVTQRVAIEDGAYLKGKVDIQKDSGKSEPKRDSTTASSAASAASVAVGAGYGSGSSHSSTPDQKK